VAVDGFGGTISGMEFVDGKRADSNDSTVRNRVFTDNQRRKVLYSVRKTGVRLSCDGRVVFDWKGDFRRVTPLPWWTVPNKRGMTVGSYKTSYEFSEIWITPISGQGQKLR
jgi:hypothetical protein